MIKSIVKIIKQIKNKIIFPWGKEKIKIPEKVDSNKFKSFLIKNILFSKTKKTIINKIVFFVFENTVIIPVK